MYDAITSKKKNVLEKRCWERCLNEKLLNYTKTQLANALTKKGASTKELLALVQKGVINILNQLYMFSFRWNRYHDINWTANTTLFEFSAFNKQVIKFDIITVKVDRCPIYMN